MDIRERTPEEQEKAYHDKGFAKFFWGGKSIGKTGGNSIIKVGQTPDL